MRHRVAHRKLGRITPHRIALLRNLATALFEKERIRTTLPKAKEVRTFAEKLITLARREEDRLHARRLVARDIQNPAVVKKLFDTLGARFATRPGGYTRILRLGTRHGDGAEMAYLELVGYEYKPAKDEKGAAEGRRQEGSRQARGREGRRRSPRPRRRLAKKKEAEAAEVAGPAGVRTCEGAADAAAPSHVVRPGCRRARGADGLTAAAVAGAGLGAGGRAGRPAGSAGSGPRRRGRQLRLDDRGRSCRPRS